MRLFIVVDSLFPQAAVGACARKLICLAVLASPLVAAEKTAAPPASHNRGTKEAPAANVSKLQAWKDAELIASLAPGRTEVVGAGDSMKPVYGENTILVISKIGFGELRAGMSVVYTNRRGRQVVHQVLERKANGWRVQGLNNDKEDLDRVTAENLVGVVYASLSYNPDAR